MSVKYLLILRQPKNIENQVIYDAYHASTEYLANKGTYSVYFSNIFVNDLI